jgi:hypothetical protein
MAMRAASRAVRLYPPSGGPLTWIFMIWSSAFALISPSSARVCFKVLEVVRRGTMCPTALAPVVLLARPQVPLVRSSLSLPVSCLG